MWTSSGPSASFCLSNLRMPRSYAGSLCALPSLAWCLAMAVWGRFFWWPTNEASSCVSSLPGAASSTCCCIPSTSMFRAGFLLPPGVATSPLDAFLIRSSIPSASLVTIFFAGGDGPTVAFGFRRFMVDSVKLVFVPLMAVLAAREHFLVPLFVQRGYLVSLMNTSALFSGSRISRNFSLVTCFTYGLT